jgi:hypothetical protein
MEVAVRRWLEEYAKHAALNFGQALQGFRHFYSHPDVDSVAPRGSLKHVALSGIIRSKRVANDLFFAAIPPQWHHTRIELNVLCGVSLLRWFQYGYCAWRFTDSGSPKAGVSEVDKRWDPRCKSTGP